MGSCQVLAKTSRRRTIATPSLPWAEYFVGSEPGVPLEELPRLPGTPIPKNGRLTPSDAPGFGLDIPESWIIP